MQDHSADRVWCHHNTPLIHRNDAMAWEDHKHIDHCCLYIATTDHFSAFRKCPDASDTDMEEFHTTVQKTLITPLHEN